MPTNAEEDDGQDVREDAEADAADAGAETSDDSAEERDEAEADGADAGADASDDSAAESDEADAVDTDTESLQRSQDALDQGREAAHEALKDVAADDEHEALGH